MVFRLLRPRYHPGMPGGSGTVSCHGLPWLRLALYLPHSSIFHWWSDSCFLILTIQVPARALLFSSLNLLSPDYYSRVIMNQKNYV
jgi:hypothetical protein